MVRAVHLMKCFAARLCTKSAEINLNSTTVEIQYSPQFPQFPAIPTVEQHIER